MGWKGGMGWTGEKGFSFPPFRPVPPFLPYLELRPESELQHARRVGRRRARVRLPEARVLFVQREQRRIVVLAVEDVEHFEDSVHLDLLRERNALLQAHVDTVDRRQVDAVARDDAAVRS